MVSNDSTWKPAAGVIVETRPCQKLPVTNWEQARKVLNLATVVGGKSLVPNIFLGYPVLLYLTL